ncbi:MAG: hypothetical protein JXA37_10170, partial [Chloroflexia bacterium]|nr:hypothetical protein [Chloroflexia bacterium]
MKSRKWAIIAGAVTAAIVLLVALGYGVNEIAAQGPDVAPEAERQGDCSGRRGGPGADAALWGWQARGQVEVVAETLGLSVEELTEALHEGQSVAELAEAQ